MRIIHVASGREWRGGQKQTWLLARELQRAGVDQLLVTKRDSELARRAKADGVPVRGVAWTMGIDPRAWWAVRAEAGRGPAILHAHDGHAVTIARWVSSARTPWIATRRNATPLGNFSGWNSATRVVAISRAVAAQLRKDGIRAERISVVPSGIDVDAVRGAQREEIRTWAGLPSGGSVIATVAAIEESKGFDLIPEVIGRLGKRLPFWWVAIGEGELRSWLQPMWPKGSPFVLPGHHPEPVRLLKSADLFVSASESEGLGTSVLDALALDVPVVSTAAGGVVELLEGDPAQLVPVEDNGDAMADAIVRMLQDPALRARCIEAGRRTVERYTVGAMAAGMRSVYDSVSANR
jgi:glycosyltransferase involved in cell wall biosynthesis